MLKFWFFCSVGVLWTKLFLHSIITFRWFLRQNKSFGLKLKLVCKDLLAGYRVLIILRSLSLSFSHSQSSFLLIIELSLREKPWQFSKTFLRFNKKTRTPIFSLKRTQAKINLLIRNRLIRYLPFIFCSRSNQILRRKKQTLWSHLKVPDRVEVQGQEGWRESSSCLPSFLSFHLFFNVVFVFSSLIFLFLETHQSFHHLFSLLFTTRWRKD